jgi:hypothetical protein
MAANKQPEVDKYWKDKEERLGGKLEYQSYAVLVGECGTGKFNGRGGLGFVINGRFYFEDFEKNNAMMAMFNRKDSEYEKTEISFALSDVIEIRKIPEKWGKICVESPQDEDQIPTLKGLASIFVRGYMLVSLKDRPSFIMEIMEIEALQKLLV